MIVPEHARQKITGEVLLSPQLQKELEGKVGSVADLAELLPAWQEKEVSDLLLVLLSSAVLLDASDLHLEALEEGAKLRIRIDGILQDVFFFTGKTYASLLSRVKLLSGIKLNVEDRPQDGRFTFGAKENASVETRVSTLPAEHGESLVIRVLNPKNLREIKDLALRNDLLALFKREIKRPNGMVLVTGPTGSGKTTTLYAFLKEVQRPEIKIITIEDPIEYRLEGISQTQVRADKQYTFASGLRAIVRQDPDVILVGEIRDGETAEIAVQASLTGHLVFSTLHTNDAAGTVSRLLSLGADPANVSAAVNLIIAQRLVRVLCKTCATERATTKEERSLLIEGLRDLPKGMKPKIPAGFKLLRPRGCRECNNTGYKGRIGIFEALLVDDDMEIFIAKSPSIAELSQYAKKRGMVTMHQDGLLKVVSGSTTLEELGRVTAE